MAHLDAIEHFSPRLLYSGALNKFGLDEEGEISTWDGFSRKLKEIWTKVKGKRKSDIMEDGSMSHMVLVITMAERLRTVLGGGWAVITRLAELVSFHSKDTGCDLTGYRRLSLQRSSWLLLRHGMRFAHLEAMLSSRCTFTCHLLLEMVKHINPNLDRH